MTDEQAARCFEPFYTTKPRGSGLGLSVCHGIASRHGGRIAVRSSSEEGTRFTLDLPASHGDTAPPVLRDAAPPGGCRNVLIIDDDERVLLSVSSLLTTWGMHVDTATTGQAGCDLAANTDYDLVVTDLGMPGMTGAEVVEVLKSRRPNLRVAVASGWAEEVVRERCNRVTPDFILGKPHLAASIADCLQKL